MDNGLKALGQKIYTARKAAGMSRAELGRRTELHETTVKRYEDGNIKSPNLEKVAAFAEILNLNYEELTDCLLPNSRPRVEKAEAFGKRLFHTLYAANPDISKVAIVDLEGEDTEIWLELISHFGRLNTTGKAKALDYLADLREHPNYKDETGHFNKYLTLQVEKNTDSGEGLSAEAVLPEKKETHQKKTVHELTSMLHIDLDTMQ